MELFVQFLFDIICIEVAIVHILPFKIFNKTISALNCMVKRIFHYLHYLRIGFAQEFSFFLAVLPSKTTARCIHLF